MKDLTCIVCPRGCRLHVDDDMNVTGNFCPRGKEYAISELTHPVRTITSSIKVTNRDYTLVSVKTTKPVPKDQIFAVMEDELVISLKRTSLDSIVILLSLKISTNS